MELEKFMSIDWWTWTGKINHKFNKPIWYWQTHGPWEKICETTWCLICSEETKPVPSMCWVEYEVEYLKPEMLKAGLASLGLALDFQETLHSRDRLSTFELTTNKNGFHRFVFYNAVLISQKCILLGRRCQIILHRDEKSLKLTFYFLYFWCTLCTAQSPFKHRASKIFHCSC